MQSFIVELYPKINKDKLSIGHKDRRQVRQTEKYIKNQTNKFTYRNTGIYIGVYIMQNTIYDGGGWMAVGKKIEINFKGKSRGIYITLQENKKKFFNLTKKIFFKEEQTCL